MRSLQPFQIGKVIKTMCGIVGVIGLPKDETLNRILLLLTLQQNRGQQGSGVYLVEFSSGQHPFHLNAPGLVNRLVTTIEETVAHGWPEPVGDIGIGHVRYSTSGSDDVSCLQPQVADIDGDRIVFAFNGNLVSWKQRALDLGLPLGTTDTLFILELLKRSNPALTTIERIRTVCETLKGAFSAVIIWGEHLYAVRDPACFRPLWLGKLNGGWVIASEDGALRHAQAVVVRPIEAGEIIAIGLSGVEESVILSRQCKRQRCTMEASYFSRPDSSTTSLTKSNGMVRYRHGRLVARAWKASGCMPIIDCIVPMVASGLSAGIGVAQELGIELRLAINRNPFVGRNFLEGRQTAHRHISLKHSIDPFMVEGKRVVVVDDSLIRGRTARTTVSELRRNGATAVHWIVATPPFRACCFYGLDTPFSQELLAHRDDETRDETALAADVARAIGADSVFYLPLKDYYQSFSKPESCCFSCFSGEYPADNAPDEDDLIGQRCDISPLPLEC